MPLRNLNLKHLRNNLNMSLSGVS
ncbi:unnamed protein product [Acanthoscelides obtectus]|uniref:Uncharacterized protein n=1 Tax=Acanthoscelides obtectus TaxID=200917 RepID=A0A9P0JN98_ACAOB|nr:unnamed protein product [Acanthoscelides obtectus]CAK1661776.1 hypothetical protein AOBTE_LOCUS22792 [Acanthoscelides obtectus]